MKDRTPLFSDIINRSYKREQLSHSQTVPYHSADHTHSRPPNTNHLKMQRARNARGNKSASQQQAGERARQNALAELEYLRRDVSQLTHLLRQERAHCSNERRERMLIATELEETKKELARQKSLKELKFAAEPQGEREKCRLLQEELDPVKVSQHELKLMEETDTSDARQQAESLLCELEQEMQAHTERASRDQQVIATLRAERDTLRHRMAEEVAVLQQDALNKERMLRTELEDLKSQLSVQKVTVKVVQDSYRELRMEYKLSQGRFAAELHELQKGTQSLREELERSSSSNQQLSQRYELDVLSLRQQAESVQQRLQTQLKSQSDQLLESQQLVCNMRAEHEALCLKMAEEVKVAQLHSAEVESSLLKELTELRAQLHVQVLKNDELSNKLQAGRADCGPREEQPEEQMCLEANLPGPSAPEAAEEPGVSVENASKVETRPSIWKQARHFLGLRKPQRWKNK